jgi:putative colanic acid biosynthesis UDP-glucose lipid carrier transferase
MTSAMTHTKGNIRAPSGLLNSLIRIVDALLIAISLFAANWLYAVPFSDRYWIAGSQAIIIFGFAAEAASLYLPWWRSRSVGEEAATLVGICAFVALSLSAIGFLSKTSAEFSRAAALTWGGITFASLLLSRIGIRLVMGAIRRRTQYSRTAAIVGHGKLADDLIAHLARVPWCDFKVCGIYSPPQAGVDLSDAESLESLVSAARGGHVDHVYIALPAHLYDWVLWLVRSLADTTVSVYVAPDVLIHEMKQARWMALDGFPLVSVYETPFEGVHGFVKRFEDVVLASVISIIAATPMALIACAIKLTSPGPVLFKQRRYGLNGRVVEVWKFRTMTVCEDGAVVPQARSQDPRVTPLGAFLRRTSLDELPQFLNVLSGDMSVVGPRPHAVAHNEHYRALIPGYMLRHKVKPGITGLAQVRGWRGETETIDKMEKRIECDLEYVRNWTLLLDLKIVVLTVLRGFTGRAAY